MAVPRAKAGSSGLYYLEGSTTGDTTSISYTYNSDNLLTGYSTSSVGVTGPTFTLADANVDGLGRLTDANETITEIGDNSRFFQKMQNFPIFFRKTVDTISFKRYNSNSIGLLRLVWQNEDI